MKNLTEYDGRKRVIIEGVYAAKSMVADFPRSVPLATGAGRSGHLHRRPRLHLRLAALRTVKDPTTGPRVPMRALVNDRWTANFRVSELGRYRFTVQAWVDHLETWRRDLLKRIKAESDTPVDYLIGAELIDEAASRAVGRRRRLAAASGALSCAPTTSPKTCRTPRHRPSPARIVAALPRPALRHRSPTGNL